MDKVKVTQEQADFRFDIYERIKLDRSEHEIVSIDSTELKAIVSAILDGDNVEIIGSLVLNIEYSSVVLSEIKFTHSVPVEIRIPAVRFTNHDCIVANIVNFNVEQMGSYVLNLTGVLSISEVEPEIQPMSEQILTEEELKKIEIFKNHRASVSWEVVDEIINSHRSLLSANAELSFEIMIRKRYEGFLKSVARSGEILEERKDFEWFKQSSESFLPYKSLEESK